MTVDALLLRHFSEYQRDESDRFSAKRKGCRRAVVDMDQSTVEAKLFRIRDDLRATELSETFSNIDLDRESGTTRPLPAEVTSTLLHCLDCAIAKEVSPLTEDSILLTVELVAFFGCTFSPLTAKAVIERAVQFSRVSLDRVRSQACHILGMCANALALEESLQHGEEEFSHGGDFEHWEKERLQTVKNALLPRLLDKSQSVRYEAIRACGALATDQEMQGTLLWSLMHDPSATNREGVLNQIAVNESTVDHVIARLRDVKESAQIAAVGALDKISFWDLSPSQISSIVRAGLTERSDALRKATTTLLCASWMKSCKYTPTTLLEHVDPIANETECEKLVRVLLEAAHGGKNQNLERLSPPEVRAFIEGVDGQLTKDTLTSPVVSFLTRVKAEFLKESQTGSASEFVATVVPDLPTLCELITRILRQQSATSTGDDEVYVATSVFHCLQLLKLIHLADMKEEGSRRYIRLQMEDILAAIDTPEDLLEEAVNAMISSYDSEDELVATTSRIVSSLDSNRAIQAEDNLRAIFHLRIVLILTLVLENVSYDFSNSELLPEFLGFGTEALSSQDPVIREAGVTCLGRLALLSDEASILDAFKPLLLNVASEEDENIEIKAQAMLALSDLCMLHGSILSPTNSANSSFVDVVKDSLASPCAAVVSVAAEVACKILIAERVHDPNLLATLIVIFFNQNLEKGDPNEDIEEVGSTARMQQLLSLFFPTFSMKSRRARELLLSSIYPMLQLVTKRKKKAAKSLHWPVAKMIEFVFATAEEAANGAKVDKLSKSEASADEEIRPSAALRTCLEMGKFLVDCAEEITVSHLRTLCKLLGGADINVESDHLQSLCALKDNIEELETIVTDSNSLESLETMSELLAECETSDVASGGLGDDDDEGELSLVGAMQAVAISSARRND